jgi:hypothetical protein
MDTRVLVLALLCIVFAVMAGCTSEAPAVETPVPTAAPTPVPTPENTLACTTDADCVPAQCCHPSSCTAVAFKTPCNLMCTASCEGPIDCGAGSCGCVQGNCSVRPAPVSTKALPTVRLEATPQRYSPMMSSTPGIALKVVTTGINTERTEFAWTTTYGQFLNWRLPDYKVSELGTKPTNNGEKIYWSFTDKTTTPDIPVIITVTATDTGSGTVWGSSNVTLDWDGDFAVRVR